MFSNSISYNQSQVPPGNYLQPQYNSGSQNMSDTPKVQNSMGYKNITSNNSTSSLFKSNQQSSNQQYPPNMNYVSMQNQKASDQTQKNTSQNYFYGSNPYANNFKRN